MNKVHDIFGPGSNMEERVVQDYEEIRERIDGCRKVRLAIVLTSGTYDMYHEGHGRYLEKAKSYGDILIVGVDSDDKVKHRKGRNPFDTETSRVEAVCHCRHVDLVFLKKFDDEKWQLVKTVRPDTLIASEGTYTEEQVSALKEFCGQVVVLPRQAATSTTAKIRLLMRNSLGGLREKMREVVKMLDEMAGGE